MRNGILYGAAPAIAPSSIVSLVPSQTELLHDLGLEDEVKGITRFCVRPEAWFRSKQRVGGTKTVNLATVASLAPQLVLANKEENIREQVEAIAQWCPVYVSDVSNLPDALAMIADIGDLTHRTGPAACLVNRIVDSFRELVPLDKPIKTAYLIWQDPFMAAAGGTFIDAMLRCCGLENIFTDRTRYPVVTLEEMEARGCELVLLSSEPFPFSALHQGAIKKRLPHCRVALADGAMFSWYGSSLLRSPACFQQLINHLSA